MELFWERNKTKILGGAVLVVVAALAAVAWLIHGHNTRLASEAALAAAYAPDAWRQVIERYPGQPAADTARLLLAESLEESGDRTGAAREYEALIQQNPKSPLAGVAQIGLAMNALAGGDQKIGLDLLTAAGNSPDPFTSQMGLLFKGRELADAGDLAAARSAFQAITTTFRGSYAAQLASNQLQQIALVEPPQETATIVGSSSDSAITLPQAPPPPSPTP